MKFLSKLFVGSVLIYPSKDSSPLGVKARSFIRYNIKQDRKFQTQETLLDAIQYLATITAERLKGSPIDELLSLGGILVPVPRHSPLWKGALWPAHRIAEELLRVGIGERLALCLERKKSLPQASSGPAEKRPTVSEHYDSIHVTPSLESPKRIVLIDDVVTKGATLIACATRLKEAFPSAEIVAFSVARVNWDARLATLKEMFSPKLEIVTCDDDGLSTRRD